MNDATTNSNSSVMIGIDGSSGSNSGDGSATATGEGSGSVQGLGLVVREDRPRATADDLQLLKQPLLIIIRHGKTEHNKLGDKHTMPTISSCKHTLPTQLLSSVILVTIWS